MIDSRRFTIADTPLAGLKVVTRKAFGDERGFLSRIYCSDELQAAGIANKIIQINHTLTRLVGTVRGLHFQRPPSAEDKLVSVVAGEIFDVAVDLRRGSPTFLHWHSEHLSNDNRRSLLIPKGFAHGFQSLTPDCELIYLHTERYDPEAEGGLNAMDPRLAIDWPLAFTEISARDQTHAKLTSNFTGIAL